MSEDPIVVYIDGSISGKISVILGDEEPLVEDVSPDPLYIEYLALIKALNLLPENAESVIYSDNQALVARMSSDHELPSLAIDREHKQVIKLIHDKNLKVQIKWIQRALNMAGKEL